MSRASVISVMLALAIMVSGLGDAIGETPSVQGVGRLYFVPLGDFPQASLDHLVTYAKHKFGLKIETVPALPFERRVVDYSRQQLIAEELIAQVKREYPELARNPKVILIGITTVDMYIRDYSWRYAFAYRENGRFAAISTARMNPANYGAPPNGELFYIRLRKMISRYIGILYYRLPRNKNKSSVLYSPILGVDDLDKIGEDF